MTTTTDVVQRKSSLRDTYRRHGYFFKEAAMLTIVIARTNPDNRTAARSFIGGDDTRPSVG